MFITLQLYRLGELFKGLAYIHGNVEQEKEALILTDGDFGRAYLTEGWARRFLVDLFSNYTVLFVGYSHNDPVMKYLATGLPPSTRRFAFCRTRRKYVPLGTFRDKTDCVSE